MKKTTLGEWGRQLPVGLVDGSKLVREFTLRDLDFGLNREIKKRFVKEKITAAGPAATIALSMLLTSLGGKKLDPDGKSAETEALLAKCFLADIMYMWLYARRESCGKELQINFPCTNPKCGHREDPAPTYDLDSFDVSVAEAVEDLVGAFKLRRSYEVRGQSIASVKLRAPIWSIYMLADETDAEFEAKLLISGICGTDKHESIQLTDPEINQLRPPDYNGIKDGIDKLNFGPKLLIEHQCPKCHVKDQMFLNWGYDSFFS